MSYKLSELPKIVLDIQNNIANENYDDAENKLLDVVKYYPDEPDLLYNLGELKRKKKNIKEAVRYLSRSIMLNPENVYALNSLGCAYLETQEYNKAEKNLFSCYEISKAYDLETYKNACKNIVLLFLKRGEMHRIKKYAMQIPTMTKSYEELQHIMYMLMGTENVNDIEEYLKLVHSEKDRANLLSDVSTQYCAVNHIDKSRKILSIFEGSMSSSEEYWDAVCRYSEVAHNEDAIHEAARKILEINPGFVRAYGYLAASLIRETRYEEAMICIDLGLCLDENNTSLCQAKAIAAFKLNYYCMSAFYFRKSIMINSDNSHAKISIANIYRMNEMRLLEKKELEKIIDPLIDSYKNNENQNIILETHLPALGAYVISGGYAFEVEKVAIVKEILGKILKSYDYSKGLNDGFLGLGFLTIEIVTNDVLLHNKITRNNSKFKKAIKSRDRHVVKANKKRLKIGYISSDFRHHSVGIMMASVLANHSKDVEVYLYSTRSSSDLVSSSIKSNSENFHELSSISDSEASSLIESHGVDILIDLIGDTALSRNKILADNPAPVQLHMMGQCSSLCSDNVNYFLASKNFAEDEKWGDFFTETVVLMPNTHMAIDKFHEVDRPATRKELGLPEDKFVIYSFATEYRMDANYFDIIVKIMKMNENVVFFVKCTTKTAEINLKNHLNSKGISSDRIYIDNEKLLTERWQHKSVDLFLDSLSMGGGTSIMLSLQVGLPVISYEGHAPWERHSSSILRDCGLDELVVTSKDQYVDKVDKLIKDKAYFNEVKKLVANRIEQSNIFRASEFTKDLELAYRSVWDHYCSNSSDKIIRL
ncbi:MAG: hypothetical protein HOL58_06220 [Francisellaceae bacterium]|jgi:tetratricopeptide (TPR) repeat protein|nr:hypothetical protein [Francisellaceae bacterium]